MTDNKADSPRYCRIDIFSPLSCRKGLGRYVEAAKAVFPESGNLPYAVILNRSEGACLQKNVAVFFCAAFIGLFLSEIYLGGFFIFMNSKKVFSLVLVLILVTATLLTLTACFDDDPPDNSAGAKITLVVCDMDKSVLLEEEFSTEKSYLHELLEEDSVKSKVSVSTTTGQWGEYIESVNIVGKKTLTPKDESQSIMVYHTIADDATLGEAASDYNVKISNTTYISSFVGISALPIKEGARYLLLLCQF